MNTTTIMFFGRNMVYKLRHKPTGLFYIPVRYLTIEDDGIEIAAGTWKSSICIKSNLSKTGKIYSRKPKAPEKYYTHIFSSDYERNKVLRNPRSDFNIIHSTHEWEVVEYKMEEI